MKKINLLAAIAILLAASCSQKHGTTSVPQVSFTVSANDTFNGSLPDVQSYALGIDSAGNWLLIGGRTNGLHNFSPPAFPVRKANQFIYVINPNNGSVQSFDVTALKTIAPRIYQQFMSTNIQHTQVGNYLYLCGGYGPLISATDTQYVTNNIVTKGNVNGITKAVAQGDTNYFASLLTDTCSDLAVTGGEMYQLPDGKFYIAVGHCFNGEYGNAGPPPVSPAPTQVYINRVISFSLNETPTSIQVNTGSITNIPSTPQVDSLTSFRRRDLVVTPAILSNGSDVGITLYGGVFTWTNQIGNAGNPYHYPIYINGGSTPGYNIDSSYWQRSNLYSAANLLMYSANSHTMFTTIFGGLVDTLDLDTPNGNPANWTKQILTVNRTYNPSGPNSTSTSTYNSEVLPHFIGGEAQFIEAPGLSNSMYYNASYRIINYDALPNGRTLLGYIYGGIVSTDSGGSSTSASKGAYPVYINK